MSFKFAVSTQERDPEVIRKSFQKTTAQYAAIVKKANKICEIIRKDIKNKKGNIIMPLYKPVF